jgi:hypothetical protein
MHRRAVSARPPAAGGFRRGSQDRADLRASGRGRAAIPFVVKVN